jgi:hypothetical protein
MSLHDKILYKPRRRFPIKIARTAEQRITGFGVDRGHLPLLGSLPANAPASTPVPQKSPETLRDHQFELFGLPQLGSDNESGGPHLHPWSVRRTYGGRFEVAGGSRVLIVIALVWFTEGTMNIQLFSSRRMLEPVRSLFAVLSCVRNKALHNILLSTRGTSPCIHIMRSAY